MKWALRPCDPLSAFLPRLFPAVPEPQHIASPTCGSLGAHRSAASRSVRGSTGSSSARRPGWPPSAGDDRLGVLSSLTSCSADAPWVRGKQDAFPSVSGRSHESPLLHPRGHLVLGGQGLGSIRTDAWGRPLASPPGARAGPWTFRLCSSCRCWQTLSSQNSILRL